MRSHRRGGAAAPARRRGRRGIQHGYDPMIGIVDNRIFQRREVDSGSVLGGMPHARADDRDGNIVVTRHRSPAVARGVG